MSAFTSPGLVIQPPEDDELPVPNMKPEVRVNVHNKSNVSVKSSSSSIVPPSTACDSSKHARQPTELEKSLNDYYKHNPMVNYGPDAMTISPDEVSKTHVKLAKNSVEEVFADMVSETPAERSKTLVVLDCANIGWFYGSDAFNATGIRIAIEYFKQFSSVEIRAFIQASYLRVKPNSQTHSAQNAPSLHNKHDNNALMQTDDVEYLADLAGSALLTVVPSGDYDDAYILNYARDNCGFIISNDFFNDHVASIKQSQVKRSMKLWLSENRCGYTFVNQVEFMINPQSKLAACIRGDNNDGDDGMESGDDGGGCADIARGAAADHQHHAQPEPQHHSSNQINSICVDIHHGDNNTNNSVNSHRNNESNGHITQQSHSPTNNNNNNNNNNINKDDAVQALLKSLSESVTLLHQLNLLAELKHVLLARASILLQIGMIAAARSDVTFILERLDSGCMEARQLLQQC